MHEHVCVMLIVGSWQFRQGLSAWYISASFWSMLDVTVCQKIFDLLLKKYLLGILQKVL